MKHLIYFERYQRMQNLILQERTGNATEFAAKIGLSRRMIFYYLEEMRDSGLVIEYCRRRNTFYMPANNHDKNYIK